MNSKTSIERSVKFVEETPVPARGLPTQYRIILFEW